MGTLSLWPKKGGYKRGIIRGINQCQNFFLYRYKLPTPNLVPFFSSGLTGEFWWSSNISLVPRCLVWWIYTGFFVPNELALEYVPSCARLNLWWRCSIQRILLGMGVIEKLEVSSADFSWLPIDLPPVASDGLNATSWDWCWWRNWNPIRCFPFSSQRTSMTTVDYSPMLCRFNDSIVFPIWSDPEFEIVTNRLF